MKYYKGEMDNRLGEIIKETRILIKLSRPDPVLYEKQTWFLKQLGCEWITDQGQEDDPSLPILSITRKGVKLITGEESLAFHPSMALIRLINILRGEQDRYLQATQLAQGDLLLDATLGLGTDALIGAWAVGDTGAVTGIEHSPVLAALVKDGLKELPGNIPKVKNWEKVRAWHTLAESAQRIQVHWGDHLSFLQQQKDKSFDVVYFDPMFRRTREQSASIRPLHLWSDSRPLLEESISEACRVARKRVVLKERKGSGEFARLGFEIVEGGKYSEVDYGVILV